MDATGRSGTQFENSISNKWSAQTNGSDNSNPQSNCCTSNDTYNSSWRKDRVNAAVAYINNFGGAAVEPYYWDANGITPHIPYAFRVDAANARTAATYATVVSDTYNHNGATYNLYPAGHIIDVTAYPQGVATDNADAGYRLANNNRASNAAFVDDFANISNNDRYYRTQTARVTMPETYPADATVLSIVHTGLYGVSLENPAENVSNTLLADFDKSDAQVFNGAYFYNADTQIPVTVYPLGMNVNGEDDGYILSNADVLGAVRTDLPTVEGDRYVRRYKYNYVVSSGKNTIKYEVEESGFYRLTLANHGVDPAVRYEAAILTDPTVVTSPKGVEYPMYRGGQEVTLEFSLNGWSEDEKNTGYFVKAVEGVEAQIIPADDTKGELQEGRYLRTEAYKFTMPAQATTVAYTTHNKSNEWAATNRATILYNNFGEGAVPTSPYYIDETTGEETDFIYYAVEVDNTKATNGSVENVTIAGANERVFVVNGKEYTAYPQGTQLTATFTLNGWVKDENSGYFVKAIDGIEAQRTALSVDENNAKRTEVYTMVVPGKYTTMSYTTHNPSEINRNTFIWENELGQGSMNDTESSYYINETTGEVTDFIYYAVVVDNTNSTNGSVENVTIAGANERVFVVNGQEYTAYPQGTQLTATFTLNGWVKDENSGYFVKAIDGIEAQRTALSVDENNAKRTEVYTMVVPGKYTTMSYTTHNPSEINRNTFIWENELGQGSMKEPESPYYINETTGEVTNHIYYAVEVNNSKATNGSVENVTIAGANERVFVVNGEEYTAYPQGTPLTATFTLNGWVKDENSGYFVKAIEGIDAQRTALSVDENNSKRTEVYTMVVPGNYTKMLYTTHNPSDVNRATILYNNFSEGKKPSSPFYIDETTGIATDYIYYMYEGITDTLAFIGSVRQGATVEHSEYKMEFVKDETTYTLYPAGYPSVTATFYLEGFTGDWSNVGYYIDEITNANSDTVEIVDAGLVEIYDDYETHNEFTNRFMRKFVYNITMPESPLALAYTTIMEQPTDVEDVTAEALQVYGVEGALVVKATAPAQLVVVTVDGRVAYSGMVEGNTRIALPAGMYIANNHKVIVR